MEGTFMSKTNSQLPSRSTTVGHTSWSHWKHMAHNTTFTYEKSQRLWSFKMFMPNCIHAYF